MIHYPNQEYAIATMCMYSSVLFDHICVTTIKIQNYAVTTKISLVLLHSHTPTHSSFYSLNNVFQRPEVLA